MALTCYQNLPAAPAMRTLLVPPAAVARATPPPETLWAPGVVRRPLTQDMGGTLTLSRGLILHVQAGDNSPWGWFARADVKASSHWWVAKSGAIEQYVPADRVAWAQAAGNAHWHSVETEGFPGEGLTAAQLGTLARLYRWGHDRWGWDLQLAESPGVTGLGWHGMGGTAWGSHPGCPGEIRKAQRADILADVPGGPTTSASRPAAAEEDDMDEATLRKVLNEGTGPGQTTWPGTSRETLRTAQETFNHAKASADGVAALGRQLAQVLAQHPAGEPLTAERLLAAIRTETDPVALAAFAEAAGGRLRAIYATRTS
ncbi:N-acetylmuramoyl-L-alanine amidase [Glutamicibacter sp. V16R2B1]|nr:N-acetylmuramoyl-L-alanine amidase [Glutamicibacter sp. V16R2B1]MCK9901296.1 N-acetylmuramoyl-L-alanine amidase [Frankia sp. Cpl3]